MRIAVDAFGGDNAPAAVVEGCIDALKKYPDMSVTLCGDEKRIWSSTVSSRRDTTATKGFDPDTSINESVTSS